MKVAIYCRLSEEDRHKLRDTDDSGSIQNQKALLLRYAAEHGWEIYDIYSDDDYAGSDRSRPAFNRLLRDARERKFGIVLCKTQSRFTRELELVEKYIHGLFPLWGVRFVSVVDGADSLVKGNKKARQINGLINEWYLEDLSENIKAVLTSRRQSGFHIGSFAPYGYRKDPDQRGHLLVDEEAAVVVREVFHQFSKGCGKSAIARKLNELGIPNPSEYKRQKGLRYRQPYSSNSTLWRYYTVSEMLQNEVYIGNLVQGKYGSDSYKTRKNRPLPPERWIRAEGTHEPIVDQELWERVQGMLAQRARPFAEGTIGLFAGKAVCMHCGYTMRSSKNRGLHYLKCATRYASKEACPGAFLSVNTLEKAVRNELGAILAEYLDLEELERQVVLPNCLADRIAALEESCSAWEEQEAEYSQAVRQLYLDRVKGVLSEEQFLEFSGEFQGKREQLARLAAKSRRQSEELRKQMECRDSARDLLERYLAVDTLTREMVEIFIGAIRIGKRDPDTGQVPVEICWQF